MQKTPLEKSICNNYSIAAIIPVPAEVVAQISQVSKSYVKKLRSGKRPDNSETAQRVLKAETLLKEVLEIGVNEVNQVINK